MAGVDGADRLAPGQAQASTADRAPLVAFVTDAASDAILRETLLAELGEGAEVRRGDVLAATKSLKRSATPLALVVDVSGVEQPLSALEELALVVEPDVRVLVVGERQDAAFYRQLTRGLGVLEYLFKPLTQEMVARHLLPYLRHGTTPRDMHLRGGRVITVTGVRGGVGATTLAANLAWHLGEEARRHTVLFDADLHGGAAALLLGARTTNGLRAALEHPDRVDELFVERTAQPAGERLHVLAAEEKPADSVQAQPGAAARLIAMLRRRYNFVVVDLPARSAPGAREILDMAHQRVLVTDASLAGARELLRYAAIPNAPTQSRRAVTVLNRAGQPGMLNEQQVKDALGEAPDLVIPWLPKVVPAAADLGEAACAGRGPFRQKLLRLAQEVASIRAEGEEGVKKGLFARWFR
ncbi:AAA family ATPase [Neoroseomonas oryzicola]|uniref:P-loop NTPase n=1 Tax=Neoroseomonas oryzicola TaxID=535904 RepID=A0A9X9WL72_9PROT|nr:P-loop NTPase [Neoroseomonas oryzicola]MBR0661082.1 P-loop NTPase [Neoroseomonas oryzicola]NKE17410.1 P-loop NTPase [Neoroseomonas oryzicola]